MNRLIVKPILFWILIAGTLLAGSGQSKVVVAVDNNREEIETAAQKLYSEYPGLSQNVRRLGKKYILEVGPFSDSEETTLRYLQIRETFPQAFVSLAKDMHPQTVPQVKVVTKPVYVEKEDQSLWTALFGLAFIGIFALFLSSDQIRQMQKKYLQMQKRQDEIEEKQSYLLEKMGEQIQEVTIKSIQEENKLLDSNLCSTNPEKVKKHIRNLKEQDEDLLQTTYEMLDFLKIKSGNVIIKEEPFQLSNMLHKLTNSISSFLRIETRSLQYDIDKEVPRYIVGDGVRIYQVLYNLVAHTLESSLDAKVVMRIYIGQGQELLFDIVNKQQRMTEEEIERLFIPSSWEELQDKGIKYSFFVTNELVARMKGNLEISSNEKEGTVYRLKLPYIEDKARKDHRDSLRAILHNKKAIIIDRSREDAQVLEHALQAFGMKVDFVASEVLQHKRPDISNTEMLILRSEDINPLNLHFFQMLHEEEQLKIILLHSIFEQEDLNMFGSEIADAELYKPVIIGDVEEVLTSLYLQKETGHGIKHNEERLKNFIVDYGEDATKESFKDFSGKNILVVEDNEVNQKILIAILEAGGMIVHKADNGRQAINLLHKGVNVDLILMDMSMPVMDGFEASKKIKDEAIFRKIPIVAVTGLSFHHEMERIMASGVDACIIKPFKLGQLYEGLERFLERERPKEPTSSPKKSLYTPPKAILDVEKGIQNVHNEIFYREILEDVRDTLSHSNLYFSNLVKKGKIDELQAFCRDSLSLVDTIGAYQIAKIFKEILVFISIGEKKLLGEYVPLYENAWKLLEQEISKYLAEQ